MSKILPDVLLNILTRIHVGLGHPSGPDLVRYLTLCGASADTLLGARALRCTISQKHKKPTEARPSRIPRTMRFNARLLIDIFYEPDYAGKMHLFMGILDEGPHLHVCPPVKARDQAAPWDPLFESWFTPFGPPEAPGQGRRS